MRHRLPNLKIFDFFVRYLRHIQSTLFDRYTSYLLSFLARSPDILAALKSMAARCFKLPSPEKRCLQLSGVTLSSPTTFFLAFLQMAATFEEHGKLVITTTFY